MYKKITNSSFSTLLTIKYTILSIISILHRISGLFLCFLLIFFLLSTFYIIFFTNFLFQSFCKAIYFFLVLSTVGKIFFHLCIVILFFHLLAGIRHIIMDFGYFKDLKSASITAYIVLILSFLYLIFGFLYGI